MSKLHFHFNNTLIVPKHIITGCKNHVPAHQEKLHQLLYLGLMKIAIRYTKNEEDAKDIVNKCFYKIFTKIDSFDGDENNFYTWAKKILVNQSLDHIKTNAFRQSFLTIEIDNQNEPVVHHDIDYATENEQILYHIRQLPLTTRTVFNLFALDGYSHREIASILGITESNSKWHLHSAREKLQVWIFTSNVK
jgi:RNA polymerase sigma factor (sigma-70 family)